ncbi:MAG: cytochrome c-type biogenesis protein CcmH [Sphingobacteriia bacterium]|nr:cytochrome c-type biogenesis protein CcmH [Sphingobacteriia bacterium]
MRTIKCTTCQGQAILESDTLAANKLKKEVYLLASKGYSKQEILENIKNNHGKDVVFLPEAEQNNFIIWLLPFVIISFGLLSFLYVIKQSRNNG